MNAELVYQQRSVRPLNIKPVIITALVILLIVVCAHAVERHGEDALTVFKCLDENGSILELKNPGNNRVAKCVCTPEQRYGVAIFDGDGNPVTGFIKEKLQRFSDVIRYLRNRGYTEC